MAGAGAAADRVAYRTAARRVPGVASSERVRGGAAGPAIHMKELAGAASVAAGRMACHSWPAVGWRPEEKNNSRPR